MKRQSREDQSIFNQSVLQDVINVKGFSNDMSLEPDIKLEQLKAALRTKPNARFEPKSKDSMIDNFLGKALFSNKPVGSVISDAASKLMTDAFDNQMKKGSVANKLLGKTLLSNQPIGSIVSDAANGIMTDVFDNQMKKGSIFDQLVLQPVINDVEGAEKKPKEKKPKEKVKLRDREDIGDAMKRDTSVVEDVFKGLSKPGSLVRQTLIEGMNPTNYKDFALDMGEILAGDREATPNDLVNAFEKKIGLKKDTLRPDNFWLQMARDLPLDIMTSPDGAFALPSKLLKASKYLRMIEKS